jgi:ATP synthase protein I
MKQKPPPSSVVVLKALGSLSGLGFTFAIPPVLGAILGRYLDGYLNTGPWITLILLGLGLVVGIAGVIVVLKTVLKNGL